MSQPATSIDWEVGFRPEPIEFEVTLELNEQYMYAEEDFNPAYVASVSGDDAIVRQFSVRCTPDSTRGRSVYAGLDAAQAEHTLHAACHNILKLFTAGIDLAPAPA